MTDDLIRTDDAVVFGDKGYVSDKRKRASRADGVLWARNLSENRETPVKRVPNQPKLAENHQIPGRGQQARS